MTVRILWILLALWSFTCGLLMTRTNWLLYLDGHVVNRIKIENAPIINFPAISICNHMVTKRIIGCHWPGYNQFSRYFSLTSQIDGGPKWTTEMEKENEKYCQCPKDHAKPPLVETLKNIEESVALNRASKNQNYSVRKPGLSSGLQVVLKAGRSDYCGNLRKWYGEGFYYAIHRPTNIIPLHFLNDFRLRFDSGYIFNIALKVTNIIRHTEHMGRCTRKRWEITGMADTPFPYDKAVCLINCLFRLTYTKCGCISLLYENMINLINEQNTGIKDVNTSMPLCWEKSETKLCEYKQIATWRTDEFIINNCTNCPPTCIEKFKFMHSKPLIQTVYNI
uniref:Uncharacterized protein n=1 Tax=Romanomermis culicivorax TaxID=13658 RepID=A0A915KU74_ROMCU